MKNRRNSKEHAEQTKGKEKPTKEKRLFNGTAVNHTESAR